MKAEQTRIQRRTERQPWARVGCCLMAAVALCAGVCATASLPARADTETDSPEVGKKGKSSKQELPFKLEPPELFGFVQIHYRYATDSSGDGTVDNDDYRVQRVRIGVEGKLYPWLSYQVEIDPRAPEVSGILRDAYLTFHVIPRHEIRVGQQKTLFGYENVESSSRLYAVNRTEIADNLARGINLRDVGVSVKGNLKLGKGFRFEDAISVVNGAGINSQADNTGRKNVWGRVGVRYKRDGSDGLVARLGVSGGSGDIFDINEPADPDDDTLTKFRRLGVDVEVDHPWFFVSAEYIKGRDEDLTAGETTHPSGWYVNLVGKTRWHLGPIVRYDTLNGTEWQRWTFGAFYGDPDAKFRLLLNYELRKQRDGERADDKAYVWTQIRF